MTKEQAQQEAAAERRVRRACAQLRQGSPALRHMVVQLLSEAYQDKESIQALQELLSDKNATATEQCTPADATLAPTILRLLDATNAASHLRSERIASSMKTILLPAFEQDHKRTTQLAKRLWQQQQGTLWEACKHVYEHYELTQAFKEYVGDYDRK